MKIVFILIFAGIVSIVKTTFEFCGIMLGFIPMVILSSVALCFTGLMYHMWEDWKNKKNK